MGPVVDHSGRPNRETIMNKKQTTQQIWDSPSQQAHVMAAGFATLLALRKLKVAAIEALMAQMDQPVTHGVVPAKYRAGYVKGKSASGKSTLSNGDKVAVMLAGMDAIQACRIADAAFGVPFGHHLARYGKLNRGMQRMNAGNRIRAAIRASQA